MDLQKRLVTIGVMTTPWRFVLMAHSAHVEPLEPIGSIRLVYPNACINGVDLYASNRKLPTYPQKKYAPKPHLMKEILFIIGKFGAPGVCSGGLLELSEELLKISERTYITQITSQFWGIVSASQVH